MFQLPAVKQAMCEAIKIRNRLFRNARPRAVKSSTERGAELPLTAGILIGLAAFVAGVAMYFGTPQKKAAIIVICFGLGVVLLTLGVVMLAVNSGM